MLSRTHSRLPRIPRQLYERDVHLVGKRVISPCLLSRPRGFFPSLPGRCLIREHLERWTCPATCSRCRRSLRRLSSMDPRDVHFYVRTTKYGGIFISVFTYDANSWTMPTMVDGPVPVPQILRLLLLTGSDKLDNTHCDAWKLVRWVWSGIRLHPIPWSIIKVQEKEIG